MKKKLLFILLLLISISSAYALTKSFSIDTSKFSINANTKSSDITSEFNSNYKLTYNVSSINDELKNEIVYLSKKVTYLLFGENNIINETASEYYERRHDYLELRYNPVIPKDPSNYLGLDTTSEEYKDDVVSGLSVPSMFNIINELNIIYNSIGSIRVSVNDNMVISVVTLPDIIMKKEDSNNPMNYTNVKTNLIMYYYFKKLDDNYKLYYLFGETTDSLSDFFGDIESNESTKAFSISNIYDTELKNIYDFSKLDALDDSVINELYSNNSQNSLIMNAYYGTNLVASSNGFIVSDGLVVTTWSFMKKALLDAQYFVVKNNNGNYYEIDGIVTANTENDMVIIKLKEKVPTTIRIGNVEDMQVNDPVITISSNSGVGLSVRKGIITSKDGYIQSTIPLQESDAGSPLYNKDGLVIGMNTSKSINSSLSMAIEAKALNEIKDKFDNNNFDNIDFVSFDELKEKYYYSNYSDENTINSIPKSKWKEFKKIGDIENKISMKLIKASYDNNVVSLRYRNEITDFLSGMQLAASFKEELKSTGFEQTLDTRTKCIYTNAKYKVIIMDEFDYLIVVMVKL